jgi:hypothetical protein
MIKIHAQKTADRQEHEFHTPAFEYKWESTNEEWLL